VFIRGQILCKKDAASDREFNPEADQSIPHLSLATMLVSRRHGGKEKKKRYASRTLWKASGSKMTEQTCCSTSRETREIPEARTAEQAGQYRPLIVALAMSLAAGGALWLNQLPFMTSAMGIFLLFLATFQLFDLKGFADSFAQYDLIASRVRAYSLIYPFIEAGLGLMYLSGGVPFVTDCTMLMLMTVGTVGVVRTVLSGRKVSCACAGTVFSLPVGRVTILENSVMGLMAGINLIMLFIYS
jgi:hypothetical protein